MKKLMQPLLFLQAIVVIATCVWAVIHFQNDDKQGFVQLENVYNDFQMKQVLETQLEQVQQKRSAILDSLKLDLELLARDLENKAKPDRTEVQRFEQKRKIYFAKEQQFSEDNQRLAAQFQSQIWKQINQYVKDYGEQEGFQIIHGADGSGGLMYAEKAMDITEEVKAFVNTKFKGQSS